MTGRTVLDSCACLLLACAVAVDIAPGVFDAASYRKVAQQTVDN